MLLSIFFLIFLTLNLSCARSEFVTLWTPKFIQEDAAYRLIILPTDLTEKTEIGVHFRSSNASYTMTNGQISAIEYGSMDRSFGDITSFDLTMTLLRNVTTSSGTEMHCSTKTISIETSTGNFYNFIQTDKPIYKPGDEVQFRVLTVDRDFLPFHRNSININITDPVGRVIYNFKNQEGKYIGVFDDKFTLSTVTTLGDWMITVVVDKRESMAASKIFAVQENTLPLFDAHIDIPEVHYRNDDKVTFSVYAKYSFGEYVKGTAMVIIQRAVDQFEYSRTVIGLVQEPEIMNFDLSGAGLSDDETQLELVLTFTHSAIDFKSTKKVTFYAHDSQKNKMVARHDEKFLPEIPFNTKIFLFNWKNEPIAVSLEDVNIEFKYKLSNGHSVSSDALERLINGVVVHEFYVPKDCTELSINVSMKNCDPYAKEIEKGTVHVGMNSLMVKHSPINPTLNDTVALTVASESALNDLIMVVVTRYGNSEAKQISCNGDLICKFNVQVDEKMMPSSTVMVYSIKNKQTIFQGQSRITSENLGSNHLTFELSTTKAKTKEAISMKFSTKAESKIYLLAFDKGLSFLRDGNDITKNDVLTAADFDGENKILIDDMSSWQICTSEEVRRIQNGKVSMEIIDGTPTYYPTEQEDNLSSLQKGPKPFQSSPKLQSQDGLLREYFPDTWIFETVEVGSMSTIEKSYITPDTMTSWLVSAFSIHNDHGLAIAQRQDLIVKNQFFVEMNLPYSIRFTEVLELEILVFNYIDSKEKLTVDLKLNSLNDGMEFQFVEYSSSCPPSYHNGTSATTKVDVQFIGTSLVKFTIRSHPSNNKFDQIKQKTMIIDIEATAKSSSGQTYKDHVQKKLLIEPVGVKIYMISSDFYKLDGGTTNPHFQQANFSQDLSNIDVIVTGDFLTDTMDLEEQLELYPSDCLEQRTSKFKRNVDTFKYLEAKKKNPTKSKLQEQYQAVLESLNKGSSHTSDAWYRAYLSNILATAMTVDAVPVDKQIVYQSMDYLQGLQGADGTFTPFYYYYGLPGTSQGESYKYSEKYFAAAYCLIPAVRHRKFMDGKYDNFIKKGFNYLDKEDNRLEVMRYALSVAAYVYALDGQRDKAENLLREVEKAYIHHEDNKRCYMIFKIDTTCDVRHTTFVALAYLTLNDLVKAEPIIYYLLSKKQVYDYDQNTQYLAVVTEPIADMGMLLNTDSTNLKISVKNEHTFEHAIQITDANSAVPQTVEMPQGSEEVSSVISGQGYCTMTVIYERIVTIPQVNHIFNLSLETRIDDDDQYINYVEVCAAYNYKNGSKPVLVNVVYEVEMQSGFIFLEVMNSDNHTEIKEVTTRRQDTVVNLFYENFENDKNYCVELKAVMTSSVFEAVNAGVKVYDYNNKESAEVGFYQFGSKRC